MSSVDPSRIDTPEGVRIHTPVDEDWLRVLTPDALAFVADLTRRFRPRRDELLERRKQVQARFDAGERPDFLAETKEIRDGDWEVAPLPEDLKERRVEITGPVDRKMVINALNSGASVFMADFEDASAPSWANMVEGQINLSEAVRRTIRHEDTARGKVYELGDDPAVLLVRPRGLHLPEVHVEVDGAPVPGSLFDFGLYLFHNARALLERGSGPYYYLPKLESHLEARWWNEVFEAAQDALGLERGTIKATVLIETLPAAFEMDEILWELREHSSGLNCGRWDYIFSFIKTFRAHPEFVLPDRARVGMTQPFMRAYTQLAIRTCHERGVHCIGGMAANIPSKSDPDASEDALRKVREDKEREVGDGHDGTWVAHPGLMKLVREVMDGGMDGPNQIHRKREDVDVRQADLIEVPEGPKTEEGMRHNVRVGVQYLETWLRGIGCVPLYNLMEDAATAEISRAQIWQWIHHGSKLDDGRPVTPELFERVVEDEMAGIRETVGEERWRDGRFEEARELFEKLSKADELAEFLTLPAYDELNELHDPST